MAQEQEVIRLSSQSERGDEVRLVGRGLSDCWTQRSDTQGNEQRPHSVRPLRSPRFRPEAVSCCEKEVEGANLLGGGLSKAYTGRMLWIVPSLRGALVFGPPLCGRQVAAGFDAGHLLIARLRQQTFPVHVFSSRANEFVARPPGPGLPNADQGGRHVD